MAKSKFLKIALEGFNWAKVVIFFAVGAIIPIFYYFKLTEIPILREFLYAYVAAWLFLFVNLLFDIHKQLKPVPTERKIFADGDEVILKLRDLVKDGIRQNKKQNIKIFAMTLDTAWHYMKPMLTGPYYRDLDIQLWQVDPNLEGLESIHPGWKREAEENYKDIESFKRQNEKDLQERNLSIEVKQYKYGPCIHGYLLNGRHLFFSLCQWNKSKGGLVGNPCPYEYFDNEKDVGQKLYFEWFNNWLKNVPKP